MAWIGGGRLMNFDLTEEQKMIAHSARGNSEGVWAGILERKRTE